MKTSNLVRCIAVVFAMALCVCITSCSNESDESSSDSGTTSTTGKSGGVGGTVGTAVDLGLSVKWADHNVGAKTSSDYGGLYGWADPTGKKTSANDDYYPSANPPSNICGTKYDIAHVNWGGSWRLPTHAELQELYDNCTHSYATVNGVKGMTFTSRKNNNIIFLPYSGNRDVTSVHGRGASGDYWSGTLNPDTDAWYLCIGSLCEIFGDSDGLCGGRSVRPVTE